MAEHRDTTVSVTTGSQVAGLLISEALIDKIWGPNATMAEVAQGVRDYLKFALILGHNTAQRVSLRQSEDYVNDNTGPTE